MNRERAQLWRGIAYGLLLAGAIVVWGQIDRQPTGRMLINLAGAAAGIGLLHTLRKVKP